MIDEFYMNGLRWRVRFTYPTDPVLVDRRCTLTIGVTDPQSMTIYLSNKLYGEKLNRVFIHELGHCALFSFNLISDLHRMVKRRYWIEAEEWACNFLADYSGMIFGVAKDVLGNRFMYVEPYGIERLVA